MPEWSFFSIQTLKNQINVEDIVVFFTPPRDDEHIKRLKSLGVDVRLVENSTDAFAAFDTKQHYGEKTWLTTIDDETVCFLDCDTLVFGDIKEVIRGDFQFKARPATSQVRQPEWQELFQRFDESYIDWMPNAGFLIFKQGIHKDIGKKWRDYIQTELNYQHDVNHKEQYALALAVGSADTVQMDTDEHVMLWNNEYPPDGIVYHIGKIFDSESPNTFKGNLYVGLQKLMQGNI